MRTGEKKKAKESSSDSSESNESSDSSESSLSDSSNSSNSSNSSSSLHKRPTGSAVIIDRTRVRKCSVIVVVYNIELALTGVVVQLWKTGVPNV